MLQQLGEDADNGFPIHSHDADLILSARFTAAVAPVEADDVVYADIIFAHFYTTFIPG